jgi:hypothetical protein
MKDKTDHLKISKGKRVGKSRSGWQNIYVTSENVIGLVAPVLDTEEEYRLTSVYDWVQFLEQVSQKKKGVS